MFETKNGLGLLELITDILRQVSESSANHDHRISLGLMILFRFRL